MKSYKLIHVSSFFRVHALDFKKVIMEIQEMQLIRILFGLLEYRKIRCFMVIVEVNFQNGKKTTLHVGPEEQSC